MFGEPRQIGVSSRMVFQMGLGVCAVPMFKIYVGNLDQRVTVEQVRELFAPFAVIEDAVLATDAKTGKAKGFAIVMVRDPEVGRAAVKATQGKRLLGKTLTINEVMKKGAAAAKATKEIRQGPFGPHFNRQGGGRAGSSRGGGMRRGLNRGPRGTMGGGSPGGPLGGSGFGASGAGPSSPGSSSPGSSGSTGSGFSGAPRAPFNRPGGTAFGGGASGGISGGGVPGVPPRRPDAGPGDRPGDDADKRGPSDQS